MSNFLEKPRGRCTPYAFFLNICREQCDKKRCDKVVDFNVLSSLCWERWGRMSEAEKKRFVQMSECDQVRLDKEMEIYNEAKKTLTVEKKAEKMEEKKKQKEEEKAEKKRAVEEKKAEKVAEKRRIQEEKEARKKKKKDPNAPKAAKSSYIIFFTEYRNQLKVEKPELSVTEMAKEGGRKWKELSPSQKSKFEKKAADDKIRYEREKQAYESGSGVQTIPELLKKTGATPSKSSAAVTNGDSGNDGSSNSDSSSDSDSD